MDYSATLLVDMRVSEGDVSSERVPGQTTKVMFRLRVPEPNVGSVSAAEKKFK